MSKVYFRVLYKGEICTVYDISYNEKRNRIDRVRTKTKNKRTRKYS